MRAGSAVEFRSAPKARHAAHPQEHQHSAAEGGMGDRLPPARAGEARILRDSQNLRKAADAI
jgi:hypothetical protein